MRIKLTFLGAAQNVTGSRYLVEANGLKILVDCGLYQEREFRGRNWDAFDVPPDKIDAVLLTHAHLDHCGLLPKLAREGFRGKIICTETTAEIAEIVLLDSGYLQEEDAAYKRRRHEREGRKGPRPVVPLYTKEDAAAVVPQFSPLKYDQPVQVGKGVEATFRDAGHILGASIIELRAKCDGEERTILFSGDLGRPDMPIVRDPTVIEKADYILVESTYGDRLHGDQQDIKDRLCDIINSTRDAGGNVVIPSFALERSQDLLYHLNELLLEDCIPNLLAFVDSPMAIRVTDVFAKHPEMFDKDMTKHVERRQSPFSFPGLHMTQTARESKAINHINGTVLIIAGSGMCTGGRIKHHLVNNIARKASTILFVGYQASGTLGRVITEGADKVRIHGKTYPVRARIERLQGFSAHADRDELAKWLDGFRSRPKHVFVTHGEAESAKSFGEFIRKNKGWDVTVPEYRDEVVLD